MPLQNIPNLMQLDQIFLALSWLKLVLVTQRLSQARRQDLAAGGPPF